MSGYAKGTEVAVAKTKMEIEALLMKWKAGRTAMAQEPGRAIIMFELANRRVRFEMPLPGRDEKRFTYQRNGWKRKTAEAAEKAWEQACREKWRALFLTVKAKFVSVESGVETFEEAFLAHLVVPGGGTVGQHALPAIAEAYTTGRLPPLLPSGGAA